MSDSLSSTFRPTSGPAGRLSPRTRALLTCGAVAGPLYLLVGSIEALTRRGFDLAHDDLSLLSNGPLGSIRHHPVPGHGSPGRRRSRGHGRGPGPPACHQGARLHRRLRRRTDRGRASSSPTPWAAFPPALPGPAHSRQPAWHRALRHRSDRLPRPPHCLRAVRTALRRIGERGLARYSALTGVVFLAAFVGVASGSTATPVVVGFWIGVVLAFIWLSVVCTRLRRGHVQQ